MFKSHTIKAALTNSNLYSTIFRASYQLARKIILYCSIYYFSQLSTTTNASRHQISHYRKDQAKRVGAVVDAIEVAEEEHTRIGSPPKVTTTCEEWAT